ncbi:MAG: tetratricopeptide repeat protein [Candidatus Hydrogenedentes bacterium]|nr:tetratricopeptide repeat protein [Candidatus Hydrogenedentota bacterium]
MDRFDWLELTPLRPAVAPVEPLLRPPSDGPTFFRAARSFRENAHFRNAADCYARSLGFDERNYIAWVELVDTLVRARLLEEAEARSKEAFDNYRQVRLFYASRALVLAHSNALVDAWPLSDISIESSDHWYPRLVRAELLLRTARENLAGALNLCEETLDRHPDTWDVLLLSGWLLLDNEFPAHAAGYFSEAAHRQPRSLVAWLGLGDCFQSLRLYDQALFYYQRALEI